MLHSTRTSIDPALLQLQSVVRRMEGVRVKDVVTFIGVWGEDGHHRQAMRVITKYASSTMCTCFGNL